MPTPICSIDAAQISPLVIADRLLSLAQDADRAGFQKPAERLLRLAFAVWAEKPLPG
jgi:hypothetical protein